MTTWKTDADAPTAALQTGSGDQRFVKSKLQSKNPFDFGPGQNYFYVLPSVSEYASILESGQTYSWGHPFIQITVRKDGDTYAQHYRVAANNTLTQAFFDLYRAMGWGPALKAIKDAGFNAGPDYRYVFNVATVSKDQRLSGVKMLNAGAERPSGEKPGQTKLRKLVVDAVMRDGQIAAKKLGRQFFPVAPDSALMLTLNINFNGDFPQYVSVSGARDQEDNFIVSDLTALIPDYAPEKLDEARVWATTFDPLPELTQIPALMASAQACEILRLPTTRVAVNPAQASVPAAAPVPARGPAAPVPAATVPAPAASAAVPAPHASMPQPAAGFGKPAAAQAPQAPAPLSSIGRQGQDAANAFASSLRQEILAAGASAPATPGKPF